MPAVVLVGVGAALAALVLYTLGKLLPGLQ
jgi:hypothetical protein